MYNYFATKHTLFLRSASKIQTDLVPKIHKADALRIVRARVRALHDELEQNLMAFTKAMSKYDEAHGTATREEEVADLLSTHEFMDGSWTSQFLAVLNERIKNVEKKRIKRAGRRPI